MKILVTGGTGFIGLGLATHLSENGDNVTVCDNNFRGQYDEVVSKAIETYNLKFVKCGFKIWIFSMILLMFIIKIV